MKKYRPTVNGREFVGMMERRPDLDTDTVKDTYCGPALFGISKDFFLASDVEDERRRLRERVRALTVHTTIEGSGMDAKVVHCYTAGDITAIFGDTP